MSVVLWMLAGSGSSDQRDRRARMKRTIIFSGCRYEPCQCQRCPLQGTGRAHKECSSPDASRAGKQTKGGEVCLNRVKPEETLAEALAAVLTCKSFVTFGYSLAPTWLESVIYRQLVVKCDTNGNKANVSVCEVSIPFM